jgi:hypothetical protein
MQELFWGKNRKWYNVRNTSLSCVQQRTRSNQLEIVNEAPFSSTVIITIIMSHRYGSSAAATLLPSVLQYTNRWIEYLLLMINTKTPIFIHSVSIYFSNLYHSMVLTKIFYIKEHILAKIYKSMA